jgi:hypothetical protein
VKGHMENVFLSADLIKEHYFSYSTGYFRKHGFSASFTDLVKNVHVLQPQTNIF